MRGPFVRSNLSFHYPLSDVDVHSNEENDEYGIDELEGVELRES